ncbi:unnamed protein product [Caenorhabditis angaria]|uniref:Uncharacterized protein n=1 Tax=Caenorhabditis angaria TaxID=860376 RepID=A0A9P1IW04_9PELO|nr:unnamed protein product [Caenorhabditis angaria]
MSVQQFNKEDLQEWLDDGADDEYSQQITLQEKWRKIAISINPDSTDGDAVNIQIEEQSNSLAISKK